jgi:N-acetylmuramoyl-L-alanine amidase
VTPDGRWRARRAGAEVIARAAWVVAAVSRVCGPRGLAAPAAQAGGSRGAPTLAVASPRGERQVTVRTARGYPAVRVGDLSEVLDVAAATPRQGAIDLAVAGDTFALLLDAPYFRHDDAVYGLTGAPYLAGDSLFLPLQLVLEYFPRLLGARFRLDSARTRLEELPAPVVAARRAPPPAPPPAPRAGPRVVAIDAGHGGPDVGMVGPLGSRAFLREKDVTLAVARDVGEELSRRGIRPVLTRNRDTLIALRDRGRIAAAGGADLFVSIHVNAPNPKARDARRVRGFETYYLAEARTEDARRVERMENESVRFETDGDTPEGGAIGFILNDLAQNEHLRESSRLADLIEASLGRTHPAESRGVKQAGFAVLATSYMPAVLVEIGYGSNLEEARYLTSDAGQRHLARAIADGIARYLAEYERRVASPPAERP